MADHRAYREFFDHAPDAVLIVDDRGTVTEANESAAALFGSSRLVGMSVEDLMPDESRRAHRAHRARFATHPRRRPMGEGRRLVAKRADGATVPVDIGLSPLPGPAGQVVVSLRDVADQRAVLSALEQSEAAFHSVFESSPAGMAIVDADCRFVESNPALCRMLGYRADELADMTFADLTPSEDVVRDVELAAEVFAGTREAFVLEKRYVSSEGHVVWADVRMAALPVSAGPRLVLMATDITERKHTEAELAYRALHDDLTGLANRALLMERLAQARARRDRTAEPVGVLHLDIDHFEELDGRLGRTGADHVLCEIARRISAIVRPYDTVARLVGDEFVIVCDSLERTAPGDLLVGLAERIRASAAFPIHAGSEEVRLTMCVGAAVSQPTEPAANTIARAHVALHEAKRTGRDRVVLASSRPGSTLRALTR